MLSRTIKEIRNFLNSPRLSLPFLNLSSRCTLSCSNICGLKSGDASRSAHWRKLFYQMPKPLSCFISCQISSHKELSLFSLWPLNHSELLNILPSSPPLPSFLLVDKERRNVRKDAHSWRCIHISEEPRWGSLQSVWWIRGTTENKRTDSDERNSSAERQKQVTWRDTGDVLPLCVHAKP